MLAGEGGAGGDEVGGPSKTILNDDQVVSRSNFWEEPVA